MTTLHPFIIEYNRRQQIFDESIAISQKTKNLDVLQRRYAVMLEYKDWLFEQKSKHRVKVAKSEQELTEDLAAFYNYHAARISNYVFESASKKSRFKILTEILSTLKDCHNREEAHIEISELINKTIVK